MNVMNLRRSIVALTVLTTAMPGMVMAQAVADSATIIEYVQKYQNAMSTHNPTVVAAFFSKDADLVPGNLPVLHGRGAMKPGGARTSRGRNRGGVGPSM
jgi:hypothetical protein